MSIKLACLACH